MSGADRLPAKPAALTDVQRRKFLKALADNPALGIRPALRAAGVTGTGRQLRDLYDTDDELQDQARDARGWNLTTVEGVAWEVAKDKDHPSWDRANSRILKAYHPQFRDRTEMDVTHSGSVDNPDVATAIDRFTTLAAAAVRAAARDGQDTPPQLTE